MLPLVPPQVVGLTAVPNVKVAVAGSVSVAEPEAVLVQPLTVIANEP